ncbi:Gamma-glutamyltranspeptidase 1 [Porphyridium purpureum]|uniref:Gamma-glutamyltranspeptidase 1 n=1 Tax=Porphyridium purpureum TaxID=35688 RepID=A0A5J4Z5X9_PORPP|nr:Gamma-glutamyltranspeptidase 1 [Porphyridium purpureum]|eukprot:POR3490..scf295_1
MEDGPAGTEANGWDLDDVNWSDQEHATNGVPGSRSGLERASIPEVGQRAGTQFPPPPATVVANGHQVTASIVPRQPRRTAQYTIDDGEENDEVRHTDGISAHIDSRSVQRGTLAAQRQTSLRSNDSEHAYRKGKPFVAFNDTSNTRHTYPSIDDDAGDDDVNDSADYRGQGGDEWDSSDEYDEEQRFVRGSSLGGDDLDAQGGPVFSRFRFAELRARAWSRRFRRGVRSTVSTLCPMLGLETPDLDSAVHNLSVLFWYITLAVTLIGVSMLLNRVAPEAPGEPGEQPAILPAAGASIKTGASGAVAADNEVCSQLGVDVFKKHKEATAADASVAVLLCQGVLSPYASGLGGGMFALYYDAETQNAIVYDARETAPAKVTEAMFEIAGASTIGGSAVAVPGELKGLEMLHKAHGKVAWSELVSLVVPLAEKSYVGPMLAKRLTQYKKLVVQSTYLRGIYARRMEEPPKRNIRDTSQERKDDSKAGTWWEDGAGELMSTYRVLEVGEEVERPVLAETLRQVAQRGAAYLYHDMAGQVADEISTAGGIFTAKDLNSYAAVMREPLSYFYNGKLVYGVPPPSSGGACLAQVLNILEGFQLKRLGRNGRSLHLVVEALKFAFGDRMDLGDPDFVPETEEEVRQMMDKVTAMQQRARIMPDATFDPQYYQPNLKGMKDAGTSHMSIVDRFGNAVSLTSSINLPFGSGFVSPSTGILMNNQMDDFSTANVSNSFGIFPAPRNRVQPGKRPLSSMSPTIVIKDGAVHFVVGASGGPKIITSVLQVVLAVLDFGDDLATAISAPRLHHQLIPNVLNMESVSAEDCALKETYESAAGEGWKYWSGICAELKQRGHVITSKTENELGCVQAVVVVNNATSEGSRILYASSDPRKMGMAAAY